MQQTTLSWRRWFYEVLEEQRGGSRAQWINHGLMLLIALNVIAFIIESDDNIYSQHRNFFDSFEFFSVTIFMLEYLLRIWICVESPNSRYHDPIRGRLRYMVSPMAIIDLLAILPFYVHLLFDIDDLRVLRSLRLLRVVKLTRYSQPLNFLFKVLHQELENIISAIFIFSLIILFAATGIYVVEGDQNPEAFGSIPRALWWACVSLTTVGYGDVYPITVAGKLFTGVTIVCGIAIAALPAAILASGFIEELGRRRQQLRSAILEALDDGILEQDELEYLEALRKEIGISYTDSRQIFKEVQQNNHIHTQFDCPYCQNNLTVEHPPGYLNISKSHQATDTLNQ